MGDQPFMDTEAVAKMLDTTPAYIRVLIRRNPDLRPKRKFGIQWMFTQEEAERLRHRSKSKGGRPSKQR